LLKRAVAVFFTTALFVFIYSILGIDTASAEEPPVVQVTPATDTVLAQSDTSTVVIAVAQEKIVSATAETTAAATTLSTATTTAAPTVIAEPTVVAAVALDTVLPRQP